MNGARIAAERTSGHGRGGAGPSTGACRSRAAALLLDLARLRRFSGSPFLVAIGGTADISRRPFPKFESYGMLETAAFRGWKAQDVIEWFHGIGRLADARNVEDDPTRT